MKTYKSAKWSSIIAAILYFIFSTLKLITFGISQNALNKDSSPFIRFISDNLSILNIISLSLLFIASIFIFLGYRSFSNSANQKVLSYLSIIMIIISFIWTYISLSIFIPSISTDLLSQKASYNLQASSFVLFGISLLLYKTNRKSILLAVAPLYLLQGLFVILANITFFQLAEFTIAIHITQAVFFANQNILWNKR